MVSLMMVMEARVKYGIIWYVGEGEHDYKESARAEYQSVKELLNGLYSSAACVMGEELLFDALFEGRQDTVYWLTDDYGFAFYRPSRST